MTVRPLILAGSAVLALSVGTRAASTDVVTVVASNSSVTSLSGDQIGDLFLGKASRFPDGEQAVPIDQVEGSRVRDVFYKTITGKSPAQVKAYWSRLIFTGRGQPPKEVANSLEVKKLLAQNPRAIGYIERSFVDESVRVLRAR
jgi:ABC-type phosphate transport system substrate-binding protein